MELSKKITHEIVINDSQGLRIVKLTEEQAEEVQYCLDLWKFFPVEGEKSLLNPKSVERFTRITEEKPNYFISSKEKPLTPEERKKIVAKMKKLSDAKFGEGWRQKTKAREENQKEEREKKIRGAEFISK